MDPTPPDESSLSATAVSAVGIALLLFDVLGLCLAAPVSAHVCAHWLAPHHAAAGSELNFEHAALAAAMMAPFIGQKRLLVHHHALRFALFAGVVLALGAAIQVLPGFPHDWLIIWFVTGLLLTSFARILASRYLRRLQRRGVLTEVIAVVGAGPVTDRLIDTLRHSGRHAVELLGVFDDRYGRSADCATQPIGSVAQLLEMGKTRKIDWILLTLPATAEHRLSSVVHRLKSLSAPIALCPQHVGLRLPDRQIRRWGALIRAGEASLPRWMITLASLPFVVRQRVSAV